MAADGERSQSERERGHGRACPWGAQGERAREAGANRAREHGRAEARRLTGPLSGCVSLSKSMP
jgi:hypothetical protein